MALDDLGPGSHVVVGCSGGADSVALLALASARGFRVTAVYVDHGLRAATAHDARCVEAIAARVGASARREAVALAHGPNLEARARDVRYGALERVRADVGAVAILIGHTRDDQAETVLLHMLRGSAMPGIAGIPERRGNLRRPLLALRRADTIEMCAQLGYAPVTDPMNAELRHRRVWMRREIIPRLERGVNRDIVEVLARQAALLRDDNTLLDALASERATDDAQKLATMPRALARRIVRARLGSPPPSAATVERVLAVATGRQVATELAGGGRVRRVGGRLVYSTAGAHGGAAPARDETVEMALPGRVRAGAFTIDSWIEHGPPTAWPDGRWLAVCDADLVGDHAVVRPGARAPIIDIGRTIWAVGYGIDRHVRVRASTRRFLWLSAEPADT